MRIAQVSPPWIAVPPKGYGGTELVVHNITEELVKRGHKVTLFATGDSKTSAKLDYFYKRALGNDAFKKKDPLTWLLHLHTIFSKASSFDIIHNHAQYIGMFLSDLVSTPTVHTLHGAFYKSLKAPSGMHLNKRETLRRFKDHNFVSISNNQREGMRGLNYIATVYNGIDIGEFKFRKEKGSYLVWLGRITPNKGVDLAIKVAKRAGIPIKLAAFIDPVDKPYFDKEIAPLIDGRKVKLIREIKDKEEKSELLGGAIGFIFPIVWNEPFGLVMVEALACGTPVVAFDRGSVAEVVVDGKTGFIIKPTGKTEKKESGIERMVEAVRRLGQIDRAACRKHAVENFTIEKMVDGYEAVYRQLV